MKVAFAIAFLFLLVKLHDCQDVSGWNAGFGFNSELIGDILRSRITQAVDDFEDDVNDEDENNKQLCVNETKYFIDAVEKKEYWALRIIDASGKIASGLLTGHIMDEGNYRECLSVHHHDNTTDTSLNGKYCVMKYNIRMQGGFAGSTYFREILKAKKLFQTLNTTDDRNSTKKANSNVGYTMSGMCIPSKCSGNQWAKILTNAFNTTVEAMDECRTEFYKTWTNLDTAGTVVLVLLLVLMTCATVDDLYGVHVVRNPTSTNIWLRSFSVYTNAKKLSSVKGPRQQLDFIHGVRVLSMLWVVLGHQFITTAIAVPTNLLDIPTWTEKPHNMLIISAQVSVDTFFFMSGFLLCWFTMQKLHSPRQLLVNLPAYYIRRYLRLTAPVALLILLTVGLLYHVQDGPFWTSYPTSNRNFCRQSWWMTFLYIQNYINLEEQCYLHLWYLAVEWQLYVVCPPLLMLLLYNRKWSYFTLTGLIVVITTAVYFYIHANHWPAGTLLSDWDLYIKRQKYIYMNTWVRAPAYLIGIGTAYYMEHLKVKPKLKMGLLLFIWIICLLTMAAVIFGAIPLQPPSHNYDRRDSSYLTFSRPVWALCMSWLTFCCYFEYSGPVGWFLSWRVFRVLGRLSYSMYLLHFPIQYLVAFGRPQSNEFDNGDVIYRFLATVSLTIIGAGILTLATESPLNAIEKHILSNKEMSPTASTEKLTENRTNDLGAERFMSKL